MKDVFQFLVLGIGLVILSISVWNVLISRSLIRTLKAKSTINETENFYELKYRIQLYTTVFSIFIVVSRIAYPENSNSQRMVYYYTYDPTVFSYVEEVEDTLGYEYEFTYDLRFGKVSQTRDITDNVITYEYDHRGRLSKITGPKELATYQPYTLKFEYWDREGALHSTYNQRDDSIPWARTSHYDPTDSENDIVTVLFADAQGKVLQTKKDIVVYDSASDSETEMMVVSGRIHHDEFGRTIKTYYPVVENIGADSVFNFTYDNIPPSQVAIDVLDRPTLQTKPDYTSISLEYGFGDDPNSITRFLTTTTDANGIAIEVFKDPRENQTAIHAPCSSWTTFSYDPVGQLLSSTDPESNATYFNYDMLGRKVQRIHPDAGTTRWTYDLAGNMIQSSTEYLSTYNLYINYYYDFNQLDSILYPKNPENNVRFAYGDPGTGNQSGRIIKQEDANGIQQFAYDELGNITVNLKTMIVPFDSIYTFGTYTGYDTWNRIDSIVYPDGETVRYTYNEGGLLRSMSGKKDTMSFSYVEQLGYDKFESRNYLSYGNASKNYYTYDPYNRHMSRLQSITSDSHDMMINVYSYDDADNITSIISNTSPHSNYIGGSLENYFTYDSLYRLIQSNGTSIVTAGSYEFSLDMGYDPSGKIKAKGLAATLNSNTITELTYNLDYDYQGSQPHAPSSIGDEDLLYDVNGNLIQSINGNTGSKKYYSWDEENRMKLFTDQNLLGYYMYNGSGERTLKVLGYYNTMNINGEPTFQGYQSSSQTLYVNPYMVVNNREYTKHYYIENQRIVSKLGGGFLMDTVDLFGWVYGFNIGSSQDYDDKMTDDETMLTRDLDSCGYPGDFMMISGLYDFLSGQPDRNDLEEDIFFYHGDHLGSTSYITDYTGYPTQHVDYIPFGEVLLEERAQSWQSPYKFNAKELDEESGLYYYGARYYDPRTSVFLGVDPMAEKYPGLSPFTYCANNPIRLVDPNGMELGDFINENGIYVGNDGKNDSKVYIIKTSKTEFDSKVTSAGITSEQATSTEEFIRGNSGNTDAFKSNSIAYDNSVEIEGNPQTRQSMLNIVSQDNGNGGISAANRREYGGQTGFLGQVNAVSPGDVIDPSTASEASIGFPVTLKNFRSQFHSHLSSVGVNPDGSPRPWMQAPSQWDIDNSGRHTNYVFGRRDGTTYIYGNKGVIATIPTARFVMQMNQK